MVSRLSNYKTISGRHGNRPLLLKNEIASSLRSYSVRKHSQRRKDIRGSKQEQAGQFPTNALFVVETCHGLPPIELQNHLGTAWQLSPTPSSNKKKLPAQPRCRELSSIHNTKYSTAASRRTAPAMPKTTSPPNSARCTSSRHTGNLSIFRRPCIARSY